MSRAVTSPLADEAIALAARWVAEAAEVQADPAAQRLAGVLKDPNGLPFTIGFVDGVMRPESLAAAAANLQRVAPLVPEFLPWYLRAAVRTGGAVAPVLPSPVVPIARRVLREMVGHLVVDARPDKLGPSLATIRESGSRLNLNLLGEAVLGEREARLRLDGIHELIRREDVDYVSVKVSAIASHISMWAFDETVELVAERLLPLYLTALSDRTFINLDMEEYRDLDLTIAVFTRILEDPRLAGLEAGIVLQAYLPDALPALQQLTAWAQQRVDSGGAPIKVRLVKGANLAMERVDATMHGWRLATHASKLDSDASYLRCLDEALHPEHTAAVRIGVAGHNLFDIAYAWLLAGERGVRADVEFEMLLGMAQGQVEAVTREVGHVLLYVPVVRPDEFDVAISYLVRRLEENASSENFLSAAFDLDTDPSLFARERDRFVASLERAADASLPVGANRRQDRGAGGAGGGGGAGGAASIRPESGDPGADSRSFGRMTDAGGADALIRPEPGDPGADGRGSGRMTDAGGAADALIRPESGDPGADGRSLGRMTDAGGDADALIRPEPGDPGADGRSLGRMTDAGGAADALIRPESGDPGADEHDSGRMSVAADADADGDASAADGSAADDGEHGDLTLAVLGIARSAEDLGEGIGVFGDDIVETAVFARREAPAGAAPAAPAGAPGFANVADSDPSLPANRDWSARILARVDASTAGDATIAAARLDDEAELEATLRRVRAGAETWGATPAARRARVLQAAARELEARRGELIEVAASETGKVFAEADVEVSEAVDFANYYAATAKELDRVSGAVFEPARLTVITPPWNFPIAIPAGGVLAALAAGSGVVFKPAPQARRCAAVVTEAIGQALVDAGAPREILALVDIDEGSLGRKLIAHPDVDRVILTGSWETAALFRSWRPELPLLAETSGKNAMIVMPSADLDLAASDLVRSAFGHAGQKCSAASLAILVGPVARSERFARQLVDATQSLRVGVPSDPRSEVGPVIEPVAGKLAWALTTLEEGEQWLVEPRRLEDAPPEFADRLWRPGIRTGVRAGSRTHLEEFFGPMLGVMHANSLTEAIELQNAVAYGLTAGLYTQNPDDLRLWLAEVQAGNLYVNRGITGAIVQRQPFGGWKRSSVGAGSKAGGPNYLVGLGSWRPVGGAASASLHLRGLDSRITALIEAAQPSLDYDGFEWLRRGALADAVAWDREFGRVADVSQLQVERNLFRYRPIEVEVRATADASWPQLLRVMIAGVRAGGMFTLSAPVGLPAAVRRELGALLVTVYIETDAEWIARVRGAQAVGGAGRVRLIGQRASVAALQTALAEASEGDPDLAVYAGEVTTAGRLELLPFLHEQSITITAHRFGNPDRWSEEVI